LIKKAQHSTTTVQSIIVGSYCELLNNRPSFAILTLFSGAILQIAPVQSDFQSEDWAIIVQFAQ
jgi:hypothetical protein